MSEAENEPHFDFVGNNNAEVFLATLLLNAVNNHHHTINDFQNEPIARRRHADVTHVMTSPHKVTEGCSRGEVWNKVILLASRVLNIHKRLACSQYDNTKQVDKK